LERHSTLCACFRTRARAGIKMDISSAIMAITTKSSTNVNAFFLFITAILSCRVAAHLYNAQTPPFVLLISHFLRYFVNIFILPGFGSRVKPFLRLNFTILRKCSD
jgi:serine acetyltransferase